MADYCNEGCLICGAKIVYGEKEKYKCEICGKAFISNARCENGHYVCDDCHAVSANSIYTFLKYSPEKDAVKLMGLVMSLPDVHMHGPEHHRILPGVLLTAYKNCGGKINLNAALSAALSRSKNVPGGACGYWGVCGAAAGAGIYASIVLDSNPLNPEVWTKPQKLTSAISLKIADLGGVRCCKRTCFTAIVEAAAWTKENTGIELNISTPVCNWSSRNKECLGAKCPYNKTAHNI